MPAAGHTVFLAVEGDEQDVDKGADAVAPHLAEGVGKSQQRRHAGGIVVGAGVDLAFDGAKVVVMGADNYEIFARTQGRNDAHYVGHPDTVFVPERLRAVVLERLELQVIEVLFYIGAGNCSAKGSGGAPVHYRVAQMLYNCPLSAF